MPTRSLQVHVPKDAPDGMIIRMVVEFVMQFWVDAPRFRHGIELFSGWGLYSYCFRQWGAKTHEMDSNTRHSSEDVTTFRLAFLDPKNYWRMCSDRRWA